MNLPIALWMNTMRDLQFMIHDRDEYPVVWSAGRYVIREMEAVNGGFVYELNYGSHYFFGTFKTKELAEARANDDFKTRVNIVYKTGLV